MSRRQAQRLLQRLFGKIRIKREEDLEEEHQERNKGEEDHHNNRRQRRLYTIGAVFYICFYLVALGIWADVTQQQWQAWPMRPLIAVGLGLAVYLGARPASLEPSGPEEGRRLWDEAVAQGKAPEVFNWYQHLWDRMQTIDKRGKGPIVLIAASGGGSRAALFTGLVLEGLDKEPFPRIPGNTWSQRVLLISSVSGGSLATAHCTFRKGRPLETVQHLRNSFEGDLLLRCASEYKEVKKYYETDKLPKLDRTFAELVGRVPGHAPDPDLSWMLWSGCADDMCTDFMAPLLRGVMAVNFERGECVSQFWQERFAWVNPDTKRPFDSLTYDSERPLVVFNATDALHGNRFLLGFPELPRRISVAQQPRPPYAAARVTGELIATDPVDEKHKMPIKLHRVQLQANRSYTVELNRVDAKAPAEPGQRLDPYLIIEDPAGAIKLADDDDSDGNLNARIDDFVAPHTGVYRVLAAAYGPNRGGYELTIRQTPRASVRGIEFTGGIPGAARIEYAYTQGLSDFWPYTRLELSKAVRASANFPWGFQSAVLSRRLRTYDFRQDATRKILLEPVRIAQMLSLLPGELKSLTEIQETPDLDLSLDGMKAVERNADVARTLAKLNEDIVKRQEVLQKFVQTLEYLSVDPHAPKDERNHAQNLLDELDRTQAPTFRGESLYLMDGGVNDNTGIASLVEVFQNLDAVATNTDPLVDEANRKLASKILQTLRQRGVIFLEIDSGAKAKSAVVHDLKMPIQAMENANFATAATDREHYLGQLNKLLTPVATHSNEDAAPVAKKTDLPWVLSHLFLCNHSSDRDVMTAWALSPDDKARVLITYFCEHQKWRKLQSPDAHEEWIRARDKELSHTPDERQKYKLSVPLRTLKARLQDNDLRRFLQQSKIMNAQQLEKQP